MRITRAIIQEMADRYEREFNFDSRQGWAQIAADLTPSEAEGGGLPRAVAYGAYMALNDLLEMPNV